MQRQVRFGVLACALIVMAAWVPSHGQERKRVAVMKFDVTADAKLAASQKAGIRSDLGQDVSDLLIQRLVQDQQFVVIERAALDKVMKEQNFSNSDRADPETAARIGKLAGADAIIIGTVTHFDQKTSGSTVGKVANLFGKDKLGLDQQTATAKLTTTARMVDTSNGVVLKAVTGEGDASQSQAVAKGVNPNGTDFGSSIAGAATLKAIAALAGGLEPASSGGAPVVAAAPAAGTKNSGGVVIYASGKTIVMKGGLGYKVGDMLAISRPGDVIKDPQTGEVLKVMSTPVCVAKVIDVDATSTTATVVGDGAPEKNDLVKLAQ